MGSEKFMGQGLHNVGTNSSIRPIGALMLSKKKNSVIIDWKETLKI